MFSCEQISHESPEDGGREKIEHAHPDKKAAIDPGLFPWRRDAHEEKENDEINDEETVSNRDESPSRHPRHNRREECVGGNHGDQDYGEHPPKVLEIVGADVIANRADDVVTGENDEEKNKAEPERAELIRLNVNDFGKELLQYEIVGRLSETAIVLNGV